MSFLDSSLLPGERVVHRSRQHWVIFLPAGLLVVGSLAALIVFDRIPQWRSYWPLATVPGALGLLLAVPPLVRYLSAEYGVTDRRVLMKEGIVQRRVLETLLTKIEAIEVDQSLWGRMLDFGILTITGTGGTRESFDNVADPLEFRRRVQAQIMAREDRAGVASAAVETGGSRVERECPYCAERILAKARVCRYCGRDVKPLLGSGAG